MGQFFVKKNKKKSDHLRKCLNITLCSQILRFYDIDGQQQIQHKKRNQRKFETLDLVHLQLEHNWITLEQT